VKLLKKSLRKKLAFQFQRKIAKERIEILEKMMEKKPEFAERYKELIRRIKKKYKIKDDG
jgi:RNase P subunit RPR2